ncbi:hypothetical protein JCM3774_003687 [Rhodotorula dairenensis]
MTRSDWTSSSEERLGKLLQVAPVHLSTEPSLLAEFDFAYKPVKLAPGEYVSLSLRGVPVQELQRLKRSVFSRLRAIKEGNGMLLEPANSPLLSVLFQHDLVSTRKSQKLYRWLEVPHDQLLELELAKVDEISPRAPTASPLKGLTGSSEARPPSHPFQPPLPRSRGQNFPLDDTKHVKGAFMSAQIVWQIWPYT